MQVLKKISAFLLFILLCGCDALHPSDQILIRGGARQSSRGSLSETSVFDNEDNFKAAMLLPLSGKASTYGQGLKNAAMMALEDVNNPRLVIHFYDTHSTPQGAAAAAREAIANGNKLILGPLTGEEVTAVSQPAKSENIPVISFSTSPSVLQPGIYTLGLLGNEQIERVISYAAAKGRSRIAVLVPDTPAGLNMAKAAVVSAERNHASVVKIGFYPPSTLDFSEIVKSMTDYSSRSAEINKRKNLLTAQANAGDKAAARQLKKIKTTFTAGEVDFDAVLIPETGSRLKSAAAMFGYYDVAYPDVLFMGTSVWENTSLNKETTLYNGIYPVISRVHNDYFKGKYQSLFGEMPNPLYSFAYDGVALAGALARKNPDTLHENITESDGYLGINGAFRIFNDGTNQHSLDIVEVTAEGPKVIDSSPKKFGYLPPVYAPSAARNTNLQIYGKDPGYVKAQIFTPEPTLEQDYFFSRW